MNLSRTALCAPDVEAYRADYARLIDEMAAAPTYEA